MPIIQTVNDSIITLTATGGIKTTDFDSFTLNQAGDKTITLEHTNAITASSVGLTANSSPGYGGTFKVPYVKFDAQGHIITNTTDYTITLPSAQSVNDGKLKLKIGVAGDTNTSVTIGTGTGFSANVALDKDYDIKVGPSLTNLATIMTGAPTGLIKKTGPDAYALDSNNYVTTDTATHTNDIMQGSNSGTAVSYKPFGSKQTVMSLYTGTTDPTLTTRLNLDGYLWATKLYSGNKEVITTELDPVFTAHAASGITATNITN